MPKTANIQKQRRPRKKTATAQPEIAHLIKLQACRVTGEEEFPSLAVLCLTNSLRKHGRFDAANKLLEYAEIRCAQ